MQYFHIENCFIEDSFENSTLLHISVSISMPLDEVFMLRLHNFSKAKFFGWIASFWVKLHETICIELSFSNLKVILPDF